MEEEEELTLIPVVVNEYENDLGKDPASNESMESAVIQRRKQWHAMKMLWLFSPANYQKHI